MVIVNCPTKFYKSITQSHYKLFKKNLIEENIIEKVFIMK